MVFTSWQFVFFFLAFAVLLRLCPSRNSRQILLLVSSIYFYAAWSPAYVLLLAAPSIIDYLCAIQISASGRRATRRVFLLISVFSNLGLLAYFKYANFFLSTFAFLLHTSYRPLEITLPVGISFFTFKALSYTIDVYRKEITPCQKWWHFAMFITYFPELVAGPIVRASVFLPQIHRPLRFSWIRTYLGAQLILLGITKKLLIADRLAVFVDAVFGDPSAYSPITVLMSVVAYSFQIYCDFSGYSDMAIGISKIIGYDLPENFNLPYLATSLSEFWRRWHMTLSSWLRDYLYIPLGGNRFGKNRTYLNLMATMLLGGLWHGASWTFIAWGVLHGIGLAVSRMLKGRIDVHPGIARLLTYSFVCVAWIFFRAPSFDIALLVLKKVLFLEESGMQFLYSPLFMLLPLVALGHLLGITAQHQALASLDRKIRAPRFLQWLYKGQGSRFAMRPHRFGGIYVLVPSQSFVGGFTWTACGIVLLLFSSLNTNPFIYFQF